MTTTATNISTLCHPDYNHHGTPERRYVPRREDGFCDFSGMFTGSCAGTLFSWKTREEWECECECHIPAEVK